MTSRRVVGLGELMIHIGEIVLSDYNVTLLYYT